MHPLFIVIAEPVVQIGLQLGQRGVNFLAKGNPIELIEHGLMQALDDPIGLRSLQFGSRVVDILHRGLRALQRTGLLGR